jgi:hypothetical protein
MIQHVWSVLCSSSAIDTDTNVLSLFDVVEDLRVRAAGAEPVQLPIRLHIVSLWCRSSPDYAENGVVRYQVQSPSGERTDLGQLNVALTQHRRSRTRLSIFGLTLSGSGTYAFVTQLRQEAEADWHDVALVPLSVEIAMDPAGNAHLGRDARLP